MDADTYMKHWRRNNISSHLLWGKHQDRFKKIAEYCRGETCVDIGCAFGDSTCYLKEFYPACWTGIDFAESAISVSKIYHPKMEWLQLTDLSDITRLWDTVVCSEVIEHIDDDQSFIDGLWKLTQKILIVTTPNKKVSDPGHLRVYTKESLHQLFDDVPHVISNEGQFFFVVCPKET